MTSEPDPDAFKRYKYTDSLPLREPFSFLAGRPVRMVFSTLYFTGIIRIAVTERAGLW